MGDVWMAWDPGRGYVWGPAHPRRGTLVQWPTGPSSEEEVTTDYQAWAKYYWGEWTREEWEKWKSRTIASG